MTPPWAVSCISAPVQSSLGKIQALYWEDTHQWRIHMCREEGARQLGMKRCRHVPAAEIQGVVILRGRGTSKGGGKQGVDEGFPARQHLVQISTPSTHGVTLDNHLPFLPHFLYS